jgi:hypothetical protein
VRGLPGCTGPVIRNGEAGRGVRYLVRDDYFEPDLGHTAETAMAAMQRKWLQGRPCLLETHRVNFLGAGADRALAELDRLLTRVLEEYPDICFMDSRELASAMADEENALLARSLPGRLCCWLERVEELPRFPRLARLVGLLPLLHLLVRLFPEGAGKSIHGNRA